MTLTRPHFIDKAWPNAIDLRKAVGGYIPREGVFPDPITVAAAGIAYGNGAWDVGALPFVLAAKRGGAPYSQAYGTALGTNDAAGTAWTIDPAPGSGSRVDRLWVRLVDPSQGEALTTPGAETVPRAVPVFGVTLGTPGIQPLPAGTTEIAQVSTPSGAASIAGSTITQTYKFAQTVGGTIFARTKAELDAIVTPLNGDLGFVIATGVTYQRSGGAWRRAAGLDSTAVPVTAGAGFTISSNDLYVLGPLLCGTINWSKNAGTLGHGDQILTLGAGYRPPKQAIVNSTGSPSPSLIVPLAVLTTGVVQALNPWDTSRTSGTISFATPIE